MKENDLNFSSPLSPFATWVDLGRGFFIANTEQSREFAGLIQAAGASGSDERVLFTSPVVTEAGLSIYDAARAEGKSVSEALRSIESAKESKPGQKAYLESLIDSHAQNEADAKASIQASADTAPSDKEKLWERAGLAKADFQAEAPSGGQVIDMLTHPIRLKQSKLRKVKTWAKRGGIFASLLAAVYYVPRAVNYVPRIVKGIL